VSRTSRSNGLITNSIRFRDGEPGDCDSSPATMTKTKGLVSSGGNTRCVAAIHTHSPSRKPPYFPITTSSHPKKTKVTIASRDSVPTRPRPDRESQGVIDKLSAFTVPAQRFLQTFCTPLISAGNLLPRREAAITNRQRKKRKKRRKKTTTTTVIFCSLGSRPSRPILLISLLIISPGG
jgi:hypothetical protein